MNKIKAKDINKMGGKVIARIDKELNGCWLLISHDNQDEDCAWPITEEEVEPIMNACQEYINETPHS